MGRKTKKDAVATRENILAAAERKFLERGVSATSLELIAREAGVTRGAIYWHFRDKAALLETMLDRVRLPMAELADARRRNPEYQPLSMIHELCLMVLESLEHDPSYRNTHAIIYTRCEFVPGANVHLDRLNRIGDEQLTKLVADFAAAQARGQLLPGVTPKVAALGLFAIMSGIFHCWLREPELFAPTVEGRAMLDHFFAGIQSAAPAADEA